MRLAIADVLSSDVAAKVAEALPRVALSRQASDPRTLGEPEPGFMFYEARLRAHARCTASCAALCAMAISLQEGALLDRLKRELGAPELRTARLDVRAYVKGSHVSRAVGTEAIWYGTRAWNANAGGALRFSNGDEWAPTFDTMHVVSEEHEVTLVRDHRPLYVVRALLETR